MVEGLRGWASSPKLFLHEHPTLMRRPLPLSESLFRIVRQRRDLVALDPGRSIEADYPELVEGHHLAVRLTGVALPFDLGAGFEGWGHHVLLHLSDNARDTFGFRSLFRLLIYKCVKRKINIVDFYRRNCS